MNIIIAFTDGASKGNPGRGGWGTVMIDGDHIEEIGGREENTTNNRMEMVAGLESLKYAKLKKKSLVVYTDSSYLVNGITKWVFGWNGKGWKTAGGGAVLNQDIWKQMLTLVKDVKAEWKLLPGHAGVPGNERADIIASGLAEGSEIELFKGSLRDYKINIMDFSVDPEALEKKKNQKKNTGKAYSYVSMVDGEIKTHKTWNDCEGRVRGMRGAKFRKVLSEQSEKELIETWRSGK